MSLCLTHRKNRSLFAASYLAVVGGAGLVGFFRFALRYTFQCVSPGLAVLQPEPISEPVCVCVTNVIRQSVSHRTGERHIGHGAGTSAAQHGISGQL